MKLIKEDLLKLREQLLNLKDINDIEKVLPTNMSAYDFLYNSNIDRMDSIAIDYLGRKYTYKELFEKIDNAAKAYAELGINPKDNVGMAMLSTPEAIISFYALNKIGALVYMVNATHEKPSIKAELEDVKCKVLIINDIFYDKDIKEYTDETGVKNVVACSLDESIPMAFYGDRIKFKLIEAIKKVGNAVNSDEKCITWKNFEKIGKQSDKVIESFYEKDLGVVVASTSGSTGKAKRPLMTNESLNAVPIQMGMTCDAFSPNDKIFTTLPIWIFYSLFNSIHEPLCLGVTVQLDPLFNAKNIHKRLKQYRFNHWNTIPAYIDDLVKNDKIKNMDLSFLKTITTGGDYRSPKLKITAESILKKNNSDIEIGQGYGASECGGCFGYTYEKNMPADSLGKPLFGNHFKIVDVDTGEILGPNKSGELYLYSPSLLKEYFNDHEVTSTSIIVDENGVKWYKTEDMAHYDENGLIYMDGRLRRIEMTRDSSGVPTKVFPDKVKQVVSLHPSISQCEILMVEDSERITRPVAFLVLKDPTVECDLNLEKEINNICISKDIESYTIPTEYIITENLPRTPGMKVDLNELKAMYNEKNANHIQKKMVKNKKNT